MANHSPLLVFDGDCPFCLRWAARLKRWSKGKVEIEPYQKVAPEFPGIPTEDFQDKVQLIETDRRVYSGAAAAYKTLEYVRGWSWLFAFYRKCRSFAFISEKMYDIVSKNRHKL